MKIHDPLICVTMSVSDPLLKRLKWLVLELRTRKQIVNDKNECLHKLCTTLEEIFSKGLKQSKWFGKGEHFWNWICKLPSLGPNQRCNPVLSMAIDDVKSSKKVCTACGRGRLFIRKALVKKILTVPVQIIAKDRILATECYHASNSILGDEILTEILQSLLFELTEVQFHLRLHNACFLDNDWCLPAYRQFEMVPCEDLGLHVQYVNGFLIVSDVQAGSVAEEDGKVTVGDVLDELYGESLRGTKLSFVHNLLQKYKGLPVHLNVIKLHDQEGNMFEPILELIKDTDIDLDKLQKYGKSRGKNTEQNPDKKPAHAILPEEEEDEIPVHSSDGGALYEAWYLGYQSLHRDGRVERIEDAVAMVLENSKQKLPVTIDMKEKDVIVCKVHGDKEVFLHHTYTEISACGRRTDALGYIAYIAGETTCSIAGDFRCHVFEAKTDEEARLILCTMAQGFERTHLLL